MKINVATIRVIDGEIHLDGVAMMDLYDYYGEEEEQQGLSAEDIVNYLLADGISVEHLNYLSYEEGY